MEKKKMMIIDGTPVQIEEERNIVELARKIGIELPTFCYNSDLSIYGACRMCMVEDEKGRLMAACSTRPKNGMVIKTNTLRLRNYRSLILELLLANHCRDCTVCENSGACELQTFARRFDIQGVRFPFEKDEEKMKIDTSSPCITKDPAKCILCGDCVRVCNEVQNVGAIDFAYRGSGAVISTAFGKPLSETSCVGCGQCTAVCPTGALILHDSTTPVWEVVDDPQVFVTCEIAPSVRVAIGDELGIGDGNNAVGRIVAALHRMGFDQVFDTSTGADLTVIEEANEFIDRISNGGKLPLFTSCCPAWIRQAENKYPELLPNVSTCRSPMSMFGAVVKEYYKGRLPEGKKKHYHVAIMPCTAKKYEAKRPEFSTEYGPATDDVLTTRELVRMVKESGIVFDELEPESIDMPFGTMSGAGVIFGVSGGVTEAVLRKIADDGSRTTMAALSYSGVRGMEGVKEAFLMHGDREVHIAVVSGLANADLVIEKIQSGEADYDLVEVMACPGGCVNGAGQPVQPKPVKAVRGKGLYTADQVSTIKRSQDNPIMKELYGGLLKGREHELLHVDYVKE